MIRFVNFARIASILVHCRATFYTKTFGQFEFPARISIKLVLNLTEF